MLTIMECIEANQAGDTLLFAISDGLDTFGFANPDMSVLTEIKVKTIRKLYYEGGLLSSNNSTPASQFFDGSSLPIKSDARNGEETWELLTPIKKNQEVALVSHGDKKPKVSENYKSEMTNGLVEINANILGYKKVEWKEMSFSFKGKDPENSYVWVFTK